MFKKILIANRGEIALRIIRACADLGVQSVLVHSQADSESLPVMLADEAYCIGPAAAALSYLNVPAIINVALMVGAEAIHPGYGFLAENAAFSEICQEHKIKFIGPRAETIRTMGDKSMARKTMQKINVPTVPGSAGLIEDLAEALALANCIGYPVLIKATAGGGGRGMRVVWQAADLEQALNSAAQEAQASFGNAGVYIEKYISHMRHIEMQVFGDIYGQFVHCGERDCSIQRRHQKLIEEAPSPILKSSIREQMANAALRVMEHCEYEGAGTIEFVYDLSEEKFYFMEMNTRIQVEHPVTEVLYGIDLVAEQIMVAAGEKLSYTQNQLQAHGHVIEFRINAEDPDHNFRPSPGLIENLIVPGGIGVRFDSHVHDGYRIPANYDSLIGKLIVSGRDRSQSLQRSKRALSEFAVSGIKTTIPLHLRLLDDAAFLAGDYTTRFLEDFLATPELIAA